VKIALVGPMRLTQSVQASDDVGPMTWRGRYRLGSARPARST